MKTRIARDVATACRPGRPIPAALGTAGWAQAAADRTRIRSVLRAPPDWKTPATMSAPASTTEYGAAGALIQPKLIVGAVNDPLEHEADRIAAQVMHMPATELAPTSTPLQINRKCTGCEEEEKLQRKSTETADASASGALDSVHEVLRSSGEPLDDATRAFMEPRFGRDFGDVRVHTGATASKSARAIGAAAYTVGRNIVFAPGYLAPATTGGRQLIAHELTHTVQQGAGALSVERTPLPIQTGARGTLQMVGECEGRSIRNCSGSCVPASGGTGFCRWSGTLKYGCICIPSDQPMLHGPGPEIVPVLLTAYMLAKMYQMATTAAPAGALVGGGTMAVPTTTAAGGATATAGAATTEATVIAGGGAGAVVAVALPVITMVGVFVALGAGYAEARAAVRSESTTSGFSQGFVMALLGWEWHHAVDRFGVRYATPTPVDEALGYIKANAYNGGMRAGFEAGSKLSPDMKKAYLREIRKFAGPWGTTSWSRLDQISYVIELGAIALAHFLRPE